MISEMANPSVLYKLGYAFSYSNIRRESAGVYSIDVESYDHRTYQPVMKTLTIHVGQIQQEVQNQIQDFQDGPQGNLLELTPLVLTTTQQN